MTDRKFPHPEAGRLSLANVAADSIRVDWSAEGSNLAEVSGVALVYVEDYRVILPSITLGMVAERAPDLLDEEMTAKAEADPSEIAPDEIAEAFQQSDAYGEWEGRYEPAMNFVWPVALCSRVGEQEAADLIEQWGGATTLVWFQDEDKIGEYHGIALTGGGMDLSDHIAAAYLCCGAVPPGRILENLPGVIDDGKAERFRAALVESYEKAADWFEMRAKRQREACARLFPAPVGEA